MLASSWLVDGQLGLIPVACASFGYRCAISALMAWSTTLRASTEPSALNTWVRALQALMTRGGDRLCTRRSRGNVACGAGDIVDDGLVDADHGLSLVGITVLRHPVDGTPKGN